MLVSQSCPILCDPVDCSPPGSSVHGILQARIVEWIVIPFSRGSFQPRDQTRQILYHLSHQGSPVIYSRKVIIAFLCKLFAMQQISVQMHSSLLLPCHFLKEDSPHQVSCEYQSFRCHWANANSYLNKWHRTVLYPFLCVTPHAQISRLKNKAIITM